MGKYDPLYRVLREIPPGIIRLQFTFSGIEAILGARLPPSAWKHRAWWANPRRPSSHPYSQSWLGAGWEVESVDQRAGWVVFRRVREV